VELHHLRYFVAIAEERSITRAAGALCVANRASTGSSPPTTRWRSRSPARVDAPIHAITSANVERAQTKFPEPVEPFASPLG
jgi:hypothetical protein